MQFYNRLMMQQLVTSDILLDPCHKYMLSVLEAKGGLINYAVELLYKIKENIILDKIEYKKYSTYDFHPMLI